MHQGAGERPDAKPVCGTPQAGRSAAASFPLHSEVRRWFEGRRAGGRPKGARPLYHLRELLPPLARYSSADERVHRLPLFTLGSILRADTPPIVSRRETGATNPTQLQITITVPTPGVGPAAAGALRHSPVMVFASMKTLPTDGHTKVFGMRVDSSTCGGGSWGAPSAHRALRLRPHGDGSQPLAG